MITITFYISEEDCIVNMNMSKTECRLFIDTVCKRAGLTKTDIDAYSADKHETVDGLVLRLWENKPLMSSLTEWIQFDDSEDLSSDERLLDLKVELAEADEMIERANQGKEIWPDDEFETQRKMRKPLYEDNSSICLTYIRNNLFIEVYGEIPTDNGFDSAKYSYPDNRLYAVDMSFDNLRVFMNTVNKCQSLIKDIWEERYE